ncbi:hypothetical protein [Mesorhizobium sp.]|uniref:hypothetical protein n=1 Tax=Mesorhizobium sp. TaxID=1871066 RepID=UPI000FE4C48F|nr:hypothetical protein [Mesorhizobium sp.]RWM73800.1 MAG: hypothetical protein EOR82_07465 [Mesorhizobium sp.]TIO27688.1 MAG: hypothetical protein E5X83_04890 [Mesorhizobium sp.]TJV64759.1 MAG: hypothetical protein E5X82_03310 [Mesorhizobium sp.]
MGTILRIFLWSFSIFCFGICQAAMAQDEPFKAGQIWTYRGATPVSSRLIVGAVDNFDGESQPIVSVSVTDTPIPNGGKQLQTVPHLPVAADALRKSVIELERIGSIPNGFDNGYSLWRHAYASGKGGYFTISVEEVVGHLRAQFGQQPAAK